MASDQWDGVLLICECCAEPITDSDPFWVDATVCITCGAAERAAQEAEAAVGALEVGGHD